LGIRLSGVVRIYSRNQHLETTRLERIVESGQFQVVWAPKSRTDSVYTLTTGGNLIGLAAAASQRGVVGALSNSRWFRRTNAILVAAGITGGLAFWHFANRFPPIPQRPLLIGFEHTPPFQIHTDSGLGGLAIETIDEAAKRAGVRLQWVETGTSSDEAFQKGLVDLWPLMADLPERRK